MRRALAGAALLAAGVAAGGLAGAGCGGAADESTVRVFAAASLAILVLAFSERPVESSVALATVGMGVPFYFLFARSRRRASAPGGGTE